MRLQDPCIGSLIRPLSLVIFGAKVHITVFPLLFALGFLGFLGFLFFIGSIFFGIAVTIKFVLWIVLLPLQILIWFIRLFFGILF